MAPLTRIDVIGLALLLTYLPANWQVESAHYDDESSLRVDVLKDYKFQIRPSRKVTIKAMLSLLNINMLDVPMQRLSVSGWLTFTWQDPRLSWDPAQYGGIKDIFDTELVFWRPEIIVDNSVSNLGILESDKLLIRATSDGNMTWEPPGIFETHCNVDVTFYPFDTQVCVVQVTSWSQTVEEIDIHPTDTTIDLVDFQESGEWDVLGSEAYRILLTDGLDVHSEDSTFLHGNQCAKWPPGDGYANKSFLTRIKITFSIKLRRKPMYYVTTILIPVIVTSILCIVVFLLPAEAGEKVGYSLTIMLTYTVMLTLVASYMPPTSKHTSVLSVYLSIILFIGMFTTFITVVVLHLHHHPENKELPRWVHFVARNILVPVSRWRPGEKYRAANNRSQHGASDLSTERKTYPSNKTCPEVRRYANPYDRYTSNGRMKDTVTGIGSNTNVIHYINGHRNQGEENENHFVEYISGRRNNCEVNYQNMARNEASFGKEYDGQDYVFSWFELGVILDAFCLRVLGCFVMALTFIVILTMVIGGRW